MSNDKIKKISINTTINEDVFKKFRDYCKKINCPMNMAMEVFMNQFAKGEISFKLTSDGMSLDIKE